MSGTQSDYLSHDYMQFDVKSDGKYSKIKHVILCSGNDSSLLRFAKVVYDDLDFTDQFDIELKKTDKPVTRDLVKRMFEQGISLVTVLSKENNIIKVTTSDTSLADTSVADTMVFERSVEGVGLREAHRVAGDMLQALTGDRGVCESSIAYCKTISARQKVVCLSDYACKTSRVIVGTRAIHMAPRWHTQAPVLFYSQLTRSNNRLMSIDMRTMQRRVVCSYSGLNMQPAFSKDGTRSVICFSGGRGNSELYLYDKKICRKTKKRMFKKLTNNGAHNVTPSFLDNGDVLFCSDYRTGAPQIYYLDMQERKIVRVTNGRGYAAAPSYCAKTNMVVYVRPVRGTFQLFTMSLDDPYNTKETQVTFDVGNKHEPCWSEDGRYIVCSCDVPHKRTGRDVRQIAMLNYKSGKMRILTHGSKPKNFPRWTQKTLY